MSFLLDPQVWLDLLILTILEIVLGIDNIVFIVLVSNRLPDVRRQILARRIGLLLAMLMRLMLLGVIFWLAHLTAPLFSIGSLDFSIRDLVEVIGGGFLVYKAIHELMEHNNSQKNDSNNPIKAALFGFVITQIVIFDIIFSIDSVITAVAIAEYYTIMATAIIIAVIVMIVASEPVNYFIKKYVRVKLLALLLILLVGVMLILHGFSVAFSEGYLYVAMALLAVVILPPWKRWLYHR